MKARSFLFLLPFLAGVAAVHAQTAVSSQSAAEIQDIGEISEPGAQSNAGLAKGQFRFNAGVNSQLTSNGRLSGSHSGGDAIWFPSLEAGYHAGLGHGFAFDALLRVESGIYTSATDRSFVGYSLQTTLDWRPKPNLPRFFVGVEPYRYDGINSRDLITEAVGVGAGTDWGYAFNDGRSLFFLGYTFTNYFADPGIDTRATHSALIGVTHLVRPRLFAQLYYQYQYIDYETVDRSDSHHVIGLSLTYQFDQRLSGTVTGSFVSNDSTDQRASYQSEGVSFGLNYHF